MASIGTKASMRASGTFTAAMCRPGGTAELRVVGTTRDQVEADEKRSDLRISAAVIRLARETPLIRSPRGSRRNDALHSIVNCQTQEVAVPADRVEQGRRSGKLDLSA